MTKAKATTKRPAKKRPATPVTVLVLGNATRSLGIAGANATTMAPTAGDRAVRAVAKVDAVLLCGGGDISANLYGADPHPNHYGYNEQRDLTEVLVLEAAVKRGIPVLGICRGHQMLNVAFGGTLHQNIPDLETTHEFHGGGHEHRVRPAKGSRLSAAWKGDTEWVTSYHHQAVDAVAPGFVATGWALDGTVEAIESVDGWMMGVQFHPEMRYDDHSQAIFDRFVAAAAKVAGKPVPRRRAFLSSPQTKTTGHSTAKATAKTKPHATGMAFKDDGPWKRERQRTSRVRVATDGRGGDVVTRYRCFRCNTPDFDLRADYVDHMGILHGVALVDALEAMVP